MLNTKTCYCEEENTHQSLSSALCGRQRVCHNQRRNTSRVFFCTPPITTTTGPFLFTSHTCILICSAIHKGRFCNASIIIHPINKQSRVDFQDTSVAIVATLDSDYKVNVMDIVVVHLE